MGGLTQLQSADGGEFGTAVAAQPMFQTVSSVGEMGSSWSRSAATWKFGSGRPGRRGLGLCGGRVSDQILDEKMNARISRVGDENEQPKDIVFPVMTFRDESDSSITNQARQLCSARGSSLVYGT